MEDEILKKLMFNQKLTFNKLWNREGESNNFSYYLRKLLDKGLIMKDGDEYLLTDKGLLDVTSIDNYSGQREQGPIVVVKIVLEKDGKFLIQKRTTEPFYGYYSFPSGKLRKGEKIIEAANRELFEETGLSADLKLIGLFNVYTKKNNKLLYHHLIYILYGANPVGDLIMSNEGTLEWFSGDVEKLQPSYSTLPAICKMLKESSFGIYDLHDKIENDNIFHCEINKVEELFRKNL